VADTLPQDCTTDSRTGGKTYFEPNSLGNQLFRFPEVDNSGAVEVNAILIFWTVMKVTTNIAFV
jgi:hypothetical protein